MGGGRVGYRTRPDPLPTYLARWHFQIWVADFYLWGNSASDPLLALYRTHLPPSTCPFLPAHTLPYTLAVPNPGQAGQVLPRSLQ